MLQVGCYINWEHQFIYKGSKVTRLYDLMRYLNACQQRSELLHLLERQYIWRV
jgi:hypothetical protein